MAIKSDLRKQRGQEIGFRTESIFPFACFGDGCDFDEKSTIIDRVASIIIFPNRARLLLLLSKV